ncbi:hypothetical protein HMPREF1012_03918 [Bacillus sp. BT1B_CT2]|nr:hypothetical protein HMPREF1012_03918 [Bacillus sp. BT1B_CT2]TWN19608.1 hypothetical protein CHCC14561_0024 [Bacillus licheniformis]
MEIRHLITFQTIVEMGSYTGAASKLGYTQSTITTHIQALEHEIGGALFTYENFNGLSRNRAGQMHSLHVG